MQSSTNSHGSQTKPFLHKAVARFGQLAVNQQTAWVINVVSKRLKGIHPAPSSVRVRSIKAFLDGAVIIPHEATSLEAHQRFHISQFTCALPCCPDFESPMGEGEHCISIENESNLILVDDLYRQTAKLAPVCASPMDGESNLRGRGATGSFRFHIACGEYVLNKGVYTDQPTSNQLPTASLPIGNYAHLIRVEPYHLKTPSYYHRLNSPDIHGIYKWIAVVQAERGIEGTSNQIWSRDNGLAVYLSQQQADYVGRWHGMRVELPTEEVKGQLLSTVLIRIGELKDQALESRAARLSKNPPRAAGTIEQGTLDVPRTGAEARILEASSTSGTSAYSQRPLQERLEVVVGDTGAASGELVETLDGEQGMGFGAREEVYGTL